jgi:hypothetical protein
MPILSITCVGRLSAIFGRVGAVRVGAEPPAWLAVITRGLGLTMRWFAHVLARLAIAATWTSSAAALDAQAECGKLPFRELLVGASHVEFNPIGEQSRQIVQCSEPRATAR